MPPPVRSVPAVTPVTTFVVSRFRVTLPLEPPPMRSVPAVTPVIVPLPVPGKVWPAAKAIWPLLPIFSPVSPAADAPEPKSRFRVALGAAVLLAAGSALN